MENTVGRILRRNLGDGTCLVNSAFEESFEGRRVIQNPAYSTLYLPLRGARCLREYQTLRQVWPAIGFPLQSQGDVSTIQDEEEAPALSIAAGLKNSPDASISGSLGT